MSLPLLLPEGYAPKLGLMETEIAIKAIKDTFERRLAEELRLTRVSAPLFVRPQTGLNDDLNGVERPVSFDLLETGEVVQIVHSLAKWKRMALKRHGFSSGFGLYTDMNAIRRDEELDNLHSVYVDQWDWEKVIERSQRNLDFLKETVQQIWKALKQTELEVCEKDFKMAPFLPEEITFVTSQELEDRYPDLTSKQREDAAAKENGAVFVIGIGGKLRSGQRHDSRAPDYDDWDLNGDILVWYPLLNRAVEISSMGIRVDEQSLQKQLELAGCTERKSLKFHRMLLNGELPLTMGGGIGQSRICMLLLQKAHIGEVQASIWPEEMMRRCEEHQIPLL